MMFRSIVSALSGALVLVAVCAAAVGAFMFVPTAAQGAGNQCQAVALYIARRLNQTGDGPGESGPVMAGVRYAGGSAVEVMANQEFPGMPSSVSCAYLYWKAVTTL
jgi:hypothetical protein